MPKRYYVECMYKILARFFNYFENTMRIKTHTLLPVQFYVCKVKSYGCLS